MNRAGRVVSLAAVAVAGLVLAACGSSGPAMTTVPATAGLSAGRALDALCGSGVTVTLNQTAVQASGSSARKPTDAGISIAGTTPPAGSSVPKGAVVVLHETVPQGVEVAFFTTTHCLAPVFQTTTISAVDQAAISVVAASPAGRVLAAQFPSTAEEKTCVVLRTTPAPSARIQATCATSVGGGPGVEIVNFSEAWSGPNARRDDGSHTWSFLVEPHHAVESGGSLGDPPRQVVG